MPYRRLSFRLPPDLEDSLVSELWLVGTQGVQSLPGDDGRLRLEAYFPAGEDDLGIELPAGVELAADEVLQDADWFAGWRERAQPFPAGRTPFLDPRQPRGPPRGLPA